MRRARCGRFGSCLPPSEVPGRCGHVGEMCRETRAQATVEYAIVTVAVLSIVLGLGALWRAGERGVFSGAAEQSASHALNAYGALDIGIF